MHVGQSVGSRCMRRDFVLGVLMAVAPAATAEAQGIGEKITKAAQQFAAVTAEAAMSNATQIDLGTPGLATVVMGAINIGVSAVDVKNEVAVRVHVFYYNPTEQ